MMQTKAMMTSPRTMEVQSLEYNMYSMMNGLLFIVLFCFVDDNNNGTDARMNVVDSGTVNNTDTDTSVSFSPE